MIFHVSSNAEEPKQLLQHRQIMEYLRYSNSQKKYHNSLDW